MRIKVILLLLCLFLTGCRIEYNLEINNDNSYTETINLLKYFENNDYIDEYYPGGPELNIAAMLREDAREHLGKLGFTSYSVEDVSAPDYEGVRVKRNYENHDVFGHNMAIRKLYEELTVTEENGIITLEAKGYNPRSIEQKYEDIGMDIHDTVFTIELPFKVIENNADVVNTDENIYIWYVDENTITKDILLKYDVNDIYELNMKTIGTKINMNIIYIILGILIIGFIGGILYLHIKKIYENRNKF